MMNYSINTEYFRSHLLAVIGSAAGRELSEKNKSEYPFGLFQWPLPGKGLPNGVGLADGNG
jgi:hypothetical protein